MKKIALVALVLTTSGGCFNGCSKKKAEEAIEPPPAVPLGSAGSAEAVKLTGAQLGQRAIDCIGFYNASKWDDLKGCYAPTVVYDADLGAEVVGHDNPLTSPDAVIDGNKKSKEAFPDVKGDARLVLVHDHDVAVLMATTATHTGPLPGVTGMNQKIGELAANVDTFDDQGRETHESDYADGATEHGQLVPDKTHPVRAADHIIDVPKLVVVAKNDATEQANVEVVKQLVAAFDKHDAKAMAAVLADDVVWAEQQEPKDWTKAETLADAQQGWKWFSDMKMTPTATWGAGNFVVLQATLEGTNDAPIPEMGIKAATKKKITLPFVEVDELDGGKIKRAWVIAQSFIVPIELGLAPMPGPGSAATGSAATK
jgi:hypothetical protein